VDSTVIADVRNCTRKEFWIHLCFR